MGHKKKYYRKNQNTLTVAIQAEGLRHFFPESKVKLNKNVSMTWIGQLQPSPLSEIYTVKIKYRLSELPCVTVEEPDLISRNGKKIPHLYANKNLCLFRFENGEWNSQMLIADTIVPWATLWLFYYELWQAAGIWCGSKQEHPDENMSKKP
ncbi:MAG: hypothetical protein KAV42_05740 [Candidatus Krumholzibacteria bacterium]|nr:hypothetical protein [Candidatus Krumholzibacteria bacterium]